METSKKIRKSALVLFVAVSFILMWFIGITVWGGFRYAAPIGELPAGVEEIPVEETIVGDLLVVESPHPVRILVDIIRVLILLSILVGALIVLLAIRKNETPFNKKNVKLLKGIALLLAVLEPFEALAEWVISRFFSPGSVRFYLPAGSILAAGLVVYCIALVFEYGISLQRQMDELL